VCLQDQHDVIERHTQSGLDLLDRYLKFVKERAEVEQNYAKQLRQELVFYPRSETPISSSCEGR